MLKINSAKNGFIATTAIVLLAMGSFAFILVTLASAELYAGSVEKRETRIQKILDQYSCEESRKVATTKDYFQSTKVIFLEFVCN